MKEFSCGDVVPDCSAVFAAESEEDILRQVAAHAPVHDVDDVSPELAEQVRSRIRGPT